MGTIPKIDLGADGVWPEMATAPQLELPAFTFQKTRPVTPRLEIHPERINHNARAISRLCHSYGAMVAGVAKVVRAHPAVVEAMVAGGIDWLADSRVENLRSNANHDLPSLLLRPAGLGRSAEVVRAADISLVSSIETLRSLSAAAHSTRRTHQAILMIDLGDLREGVWPESAVDVLRQATHLPSLEVVGVGTNLACYGGVVPTATSLQRLVDVRDALREATDLSLDIISGGNSANLPLLDSGLTPPEVNHFRMGESIILGRNVLDRTAWPGTRQDALRLVTELIEVERKPSVPVGEVAQNAFGEAPQFVDRGIRRRGIVNLGRQDVQIDGLEPVDPRIAIIGGSSDHLILDVEDAPELTVGAEVAFWPSYGAVLALSTSPYVPVTVVH